MRLRSAHQQGLQPSKGLMLVTGGSSSRKTQAYGQQARAAVGGRPYSCPYEPLHSLMDSFLQGELRPGRKLQSGL